MRTAQITTAHHERLAYVYVRQSTLWQVSEHQESTERQYRLQVALRQLCKQNDHCLGLWFWPPARLCCHLAWCRRRSTGVSVGDAGRLLVRRSE